MNQPYKQFSELNSKTIDQIQPSSPTSKYRIRIRQLRPSRTSNVFTRQQSVDKKVFTFFTWQQLVDKKVANVFTGQQSDDKKVINVYTWQQSVDEKRVCFYLTVDKKLMLLLDSNQLIKKSIKRILTQKVNNNCVSSSNQLIKMILTQKVNNNCVSSERVHSSFLKAQFYYIQGCSMPYSSNGPTALHVFKLITYKKKIEENFVNLM